MNGSQARLQRDKMLKALKGEGWKGEVWENLGWHCCAYLGNLVIYYSEHIDGYHCLLSTDAPGTGETYWSTNEHFKDPNEAVQDQLRRAREHIARCEQAIAAVEAKFNK